MDYLKGQRFKNVFSGDNVTITGCLNQSDESYVNYKKDVPEVFEGTHKDDPPRMFYDFSKPIRVFEQTYAKI